MIKLHSKNITKTITIYSVSKNTRLLTITLANVDFQNSFTGTFPMKLSMHLLQGFPPHLNHVATLPCKV